MNEIINFKLAPPFICLIACLGIFGCKKEVAQDLHNLLSLASQERTEVNPTVTHGMLHFESFTDLTAFTQSLQNQEADSAQVRSAYTSLGIDVNAETLPNLTDYPICYLREQAIGGYTSARKAEETVINAALNNGDDNVNSIIIFPFWKTALNNNHSVQVGSRIYKYYDNGGVAIVLNEDWVLYESIKALPFELLRESFNLIVTSDAREGWDKYFTFNADQSINAAKRIFMPRFVAEQAPSGKLAISNVSLVESTFGEGAFKWIYSDNTWSIGKNPNKTIHPNENLKVIVDNGLDPRDTITGEEIVLICTTDNFTITYLPNNQVRFELPGYNPATSQYNIRWVFSDGTTSTSNPVTKTFTSNGTATCQLFWKSDGTLACESTKPFFAKCGDKKIITNTDIFEQSNQRWKLDGSIWVLTGEVGCKVKYLRWRGAILGWQPAYNQAACADISGTYIREVYNPNKNCIDITASGSKCLGAGTFPTSVSYLIPEVSEVFDKPNLLSAGLGIKVNGTWRGWGYAGKPRLVLP